MLSFPLRQWLLRLLAVSGGCLVHRASPGPPAKVLLIKPDHLGDLLLAGPALTRLRRALPASRLVGLVGPWSRQMWQDRPELDELLLLPFPAFERTVSAPPGGRVAQLMARLQPWLLLFKYGMLLRCERYDAALLLRDDHWWGAALALLAGIPRRIGQGHPHCTPLLSTALPYDPREHVTRQALAVVAALTGGRPPSAVLGDPPLSFRPDTTDEAWAAEWCAAHLGMGERLVIIHAGTGGRVKHWPEANWTVVADQMAALPGVRLFFTGGPAEAALVERIMAGMRHASFSLVGQTTTGQLAALLGRAVLVLGVDSGPLHLAVSQGVPSLHLFGPSDDRRFGPWGQASRHIVLRAGLACSPCGTFEHCPRGTEGPECMLMINPAVVIAAGRALLERD